MHRRLILLICSMALAGCAHGPCKALGSLFGCDCVKRSAHPSMQDMSIQLPVFDSALQVDATLDGHMLQATRIAADDYLDPTRSDPPCQLKQESYEYRALRQGEVVFVRIDFKPQSCGDNIDMLDAGATYAISVDGRILRRALDGFGPF
jgi:hypothetical protein